MAATTLADVFSSALIAEKMGAHWAYLQADAFRVPSHPAFSYQGRINAALTNVLVAQKRGGRGRTIMAPRADGAALTASTIEVSQVDLTIGGFGLLYESTDLLRMCDDRGFFDPTLLVADMFAAYEGAFADLVANLLDTFGSAVGASGTNNSLANFLAAKQVLEVANNEGPYIYLGHTQAITDLQNDLATNSAGSIQWLDSTGAMIDQPQGAYKGRFLQVDVMQTTRAPTMNAGADVASAMLAPNAIAWGDGVNPLEFPGDQVYVGPVLFERERTGRSATSAYMGHGNLAAVEWFDDAGQTIQSDA